MLDLRRPQSRTRIGVWQVNESRPSAGKYLHLKTLTSADCERGSQDTSDDIPMQV
jgi:hypothetical protein